MAIIDMIDTIDTRTEHRSRFSAVRVIPRDTVLRERPSVQAPHRPRRAVPTRPAGAALGYRRSGVLMSRASHRRKPITPATTVLLALIAAGITVWLGLVAQIGGVVGPTVQDSGQELAVVQVESGETLQQVARRVAPNAPVSRVVQQIRDLNELDSSAIDAGQTLIAPIG